MTHEEAIAIAAPHSMFEEHRWGVLRQAVDALDRPGCIVECGVAKGGVSAYMALRCPDRQVYGYCSFDKGLRGVSSRDGSNQHDGMLSDSPREWVEQWLASVGATNVKLIGGDVRETLPAEHEPVALAVVDLNIWAPTLFALEWIKRHAARGCRVLVDDRDFVGVAAALSDSGIAWTNDGYMAKAVL